MQVVWLLRALNSLSSLENLYRDCIHYWPVSSAPRLYPDSGLKLKCYACSRGVSVQYWTSSEIIGGDDQWLLNSEEHHLIVTGVPNVIRCGD